MPAEWMMDAEGDSSRAGSAPVDTDADAGSDSGAAVAVEEKTRESPTPVNRLPQWKVLLHNDDVNLIEDVINAIQEIVKLNHLEALMRTLEAHHRGIALLATTHRERAELMREQFDSKLLTVTIEPDR